MSRTRAIAILFSSVTAFAAAESFAAPQPLPQLPGGGAPTPVGPNVTQQAQNAANTALDLAQTLEQLRKGVVQIEQQGRPLGIGTVLSNDGRILTALSSLPAGTDAPDIRYADGSVVKTKLGHKDKNWDLALLVPQSGKWLDGLVPTDADPSTAELRTFAPKAGKLAATGIALKNRIDARSKDGDPLKSVLDLDLKGVPTVPGAPVLDQNGKVFGVMVHACKDAQAAADLKKDDAKKDDAKKDDAKPAACSPINVAAPVYALRSFLMKTPATATQPAPWLGLGGAPVESGNVRGVRVVGIAPGSPAAAAGLKAGADPDTIVAVDGQPVEMPEQLAEAVSKRAIGQTMKFLVFSQGKFREAAVTLKAAPPPAPPQ